MRRDEDGEVEMRRELWGEEIRYLERRGDQERHEGT